MDEKSLCPRLLDFIVLVGRRANSRLQPHGAPHFLRSEDVGGAPLKRQSTSAGGVANPELLRCYPSENHKDFELPTDVTYFCQPEGCITIGSSQRRWHAYRDTTLFVFTLTEKDSAKIRYGISLNFFLNSERKPANPTTVTTTNPNNNVSSSGISSGTAGEESALNSEKVTNKRRNTTCSSSLTSLCLISHHPFLSTFRDLLILLRQLIDSSNFRCNRDETIPKDAVWSVLMGHWARGAVPTAVMEEIRQIETWILTLLSSPVPVPGKTKVVIEVLPLDIMPMLEFALPDHTRFSLVDFPLHLPIELLGVDVVSRLLSAIMLEYKVILQSRNYNAVSMCVMALVALMYPLEYMFPIIPLLPVFMPSAEQLLLAPTPYIIGVPASFFVVKNITVPSDVLLIDLDTNELTISSEVANIPEFPEPEATNLKEAFRKALGKVSSERMNGGGGGVGAPRSITSDNLADLSRSSTNLQLHNANSGQSPPQQPLDESQQLEQNEICGAGAFESGYTVDSDEIDIAVRVAMVQFYNSPNIFANFSEHSRTLRLYPRPVVALQTESFLRSRPVQSEFITELCRTQAVEYFAESSLCPRNETYVRIHTGVSSPSQIGDKAKWFSEQLMPIHFNAYPNNAKLADALVQMRTERPNNLLSDSDDEDTSDLESSYSGGMDESLYSDSSFDSRSPVNFERFKPLSELAVDAYNAPKHLKLPQSHSALSISSSVSSGRSSPESSMSMAASVVDSEADFVRLAENLALKSDSKGEFTFDHSSADDEFQLNSAFKRGSISSTSSSPATKSAAFKALRNVLADSTAASTSSATSTSSVVGSDGSKKVPQFMDALNGYAEKSQGMLSQMFRKTAPKAQALHDKTMRPLAEAAANRMEHGQHLMQKKQTQNTQKSSAATATQQRKGQQTISEICEQILQGQSIGVFTYPKVKRLLEDENLRELACSKLNLNLENRYSEEDFEPEVQLTRSQYKGYLKILVACVIGLQHSFNTPGSNGLASMFHVLEIAHTHFWANGGDGSGVETPGSEVMSLVNTPSGSSHNLTMASSLAASLPNASTANINLGEVTPQRQESPSSITGPEGVAQRAQPPPPTMAPPPLPPQIPPPPLPQRAPPLPPRRVSPKREKSSENSQKSTSTAPPPPQRPPPPNLLIISSSDNETSHHGTELIAPPPSSSNDKPLSNPKPQPNGNVLSNKSFVGKSTPSTTQKSSSSRSAASPPPVIAARSSNSSAGGSSSSDHPRHFLYVDVLVACNKTDLWQNLVFWENAFFDMVSQEREIIGMDQEPSEMIDRYGGLSESEKKRLELDEDRILATLLHNLTAYMLMCRTPTKSLQQKVRRLLGKAHIGLVYSKKINQLLDDLPNYQNNRIPLKILGSRLMQKQSFTVHNGSAEGTMLFLEVCDDALILREMSGAIAERWWYERLVNMTYSPKTKMLCLWRRQDDHVHMHKFYTKKCRHLYNCMKGAMERAASRGKVTVVGRDLGGEFPIHDIEHNEGGLLQVRIDGIALLFANRQEFVDLANIKKCNTFGGNIFVLEELNRSKGQLLQRRYISTMAVEMAWALHRIFSVKLALDECKKRDALDESGVVMHRTNNLSESRVILPLAPLGERRSRSISPKIPRQSGTKSNENGLTTIKESVSNGEDTEHHMDASKCKRGKSRSCTENELLGRRNVADPPQLLLNGGTFSTNDAEDEPRLKSSILLPMRL